VSMALSFSTTFFASSRSPESRAWVRRPSPHPPMRRSARFEAYLLVGGGDNGVSSSGSERFPNSRFIDKGYRRLQGISMVECPDERDRMVAVLSAVVGLALGVAITWVLTGEARASLREDVLRAEADLKVRDSQLSESNERLERQRVDHETSMTQMGQTFKVLSTKHSMRRCSFQSISEETHKLRESKLDSTLKPLEELLANTRRISRTSTPECRCAVRRQEQSAAELLEAQRRREYETRRLNQLLGRSSQRARGASPTRPTCDERLEASQGIDTELQVTATNGRRTITSTRLSVVNVPNGHQARG